mmetsp:Transcript_8693/g.32047  ORF Transcript_8693/g.32047 Transcript_8693/m.32047 type:complete len:360 (+) Transcript_8693:78-1157(+)
MSNAEDYQEEYEEELEEEEEEDGIIEDGDEIIEELDGGISIAGLAPLPDRSGASGAQPAVKEWAGLRDMSSATQQKLLASLSALRSADMDTLTVMIVGKNGMGKSSLVNSLFGERVAPTGYFTQQDDKPELYSRNTAGFVLNVIDTPDLLDGDTVDEAAMMGLSEYLSDKEVHAVIYCDRLDLYRVDSRDQMAISALTRYFGADIWRITLLALTHGQYIPPDGLQYDDFVNARVGRLHKALGAAAGGANSSTGQVASNLPVQIVENSSRCRSNGDGEKVLPNDEAWQAALVEKLVQIATGSSPLYHDSEAQENACNRRGKLWIIPLAALQIGLVVPLVKKVIQRDLKAEQERAIPRKET